MSDTRSKWHLFLQEHKGKGYNMQQLSKMYRKLHQVQSPPRRTGSYCVGLKQEDCVNKPPCHWRRHPKTPHCYMGLPQGKTARKPGPVRALVQDPAPIRLFANFASGHKHEGGPFSLFPAAMMKSVQQAEKQRAQQAEKQRAQQAEKQRAQQAEKQRAQQAEKQRAQQAERQRAQQAEKQRAQQAEKQRAQQAEKQRAQQAEKQRAQQAERERARAEVRAARSKEARRLLAAKEAEALRDDMARNDRPLMFWN